jgi:pyridoxamine 5'-phosphate oxidase
VNPLELLAEDRAAAQRSADPWASLCVLATTRADGTPQARVLVLREEEGGLAIFVNTTSPKVREIGHQPTAAVLVYLATLGVQYRLEATLVPLASELVHERWKLRPDIPKVMDWLYETRAAQSSEISSRDALLNLFDDVDTQLPEPVVAPTAAIGYQLDVTGIERLQLSGDRVHERDRYQLIGEGWTHTVLVP